MTVTGIKILPNYQLELSVVVHQEDLVTSNELKLLRKLGFVLRFVDA
jgi:hypothetical protein